MSAKELTAYVTRTKRVSRFSAEKAADAVKRFLPAIEDAMEEAAQLQRSLQEAELVEAGAQFEEAFQKIGAIRRITNELTGQTRTLVQAFRELEDVNTRISQAATEPVPVSVRGRAVPKPKAVKQQVVKSKPER